jgi:hypothetical protein
MQITKLFILLTILLVNCPLTAQITVFPGKHTGAGTSYELLSVPHRPKKLMSHEKSLAHHHAIRQFAQTSIQTDSTVLLLDSVKENNPSGFYWEAFLYNKKGKLTSYYFFGGSFIEKNFYKEMYNYSLHDSLESIHEYSQEINGYPSVTAYENSFLGPGWSSLFSYNSNGYLAQHLVQLSSSDVERMLYGYYPDNKLSSRLYQIPITGTGDWKSEVKFRHFYDGQGRDSALVTYKNHFGGAALLKDHITQTFYNNVNLPEEIHSYRVSLTDSNDITLVGFEQFDYDNFGNCTHHTKNEIYHSSTYTDTMYTVQLEYHRCHQAPDSVIRWYGQTILPDFTGKYRELYYYQSRPCLPDTIIRQDYNKATEQFVNSRKYVFEYDAWDNIVSVLIYRFINQLWVLDVDVVCFYGWHLIDISGVDASATNNLIQPLHVYPNPTSGLLRLDIPLGDPFAVQVYNTLGQQIEEPGNRYNPELDLSAYPTGMYLIRVMQNNSVYQQKVLKQ